MSDFKIFCSTSLGINKCSIAEYHKSRSSSCKPSLIGPKNTSFSSLKYMLCIDILR